MPEDAAVYRTPPDHARSPGPDLGPDLAPPPDFAPPPDLTPPLSFGNDAGACVVRQQVKPCVPKQKTFELPRYLTGFQSPQYVSIGDLNGDGWNDIVVSDLGKGCMYPEVGVILNKGDGTFAAPDLYFADCRLGITRFGDLNSDGHVDIVVIGNRSANVFLNLGNGKFGNSVTYMYPEIDGAYGGEIADVNCDGWLDLVTPNFMYLNQKDGTLRFLVTYSKPDRAGPWRAIAISDLDGDAWPDLVLCGDDPFSVYSNQGGRFVRTYMLGHSCHRFDLSLGDLNHDSRLDALAGTAALLGDGHGLFLWPPTDMIKQNHPRLNDVNGDGFADVVFGLANPSVMLGNGDGTFGMIVPQGFALSPTDPEWTLGDLDGDCFDDIAGVNQTNGRVPLFHNMKDGTFYQY